MFGELAYNTRDVRDDKDTVVPSSPGGQGLVQVRFQISDKDTKIPETIHPFHLSAILTR